MEIKHRDIEIPDKNPFINCRLNREMEANSLTNIIENYGKGFTMAVDGRWGEGKTTFIRMWQKKLNNKGYKTIYLNSWENDFMSDPLLYILGEMRFFFSSEGEHKFDDVVKLGGAFSKKSIPALVKFVSSLIPVVRNASELLSDLSENTLPSFNEEVSSYQERKENILEFRRTLQDLVKEKCKDRPLVIFIDELDRCRPDYAVDFLEKIKHFFSIDNIVFVFSVNKDQLAASIKGYYGSDTIDSVEYLKRFIDIEYSLKKPDIKSFCEYLYYYMGFNEFMECNERLSNSDFKYDKEYFINISDIIFHDKNFTLRQIEKLYAQVRISLLGMDKGSSLFVDVFLILSFLRYYQVDLYYKIKTLSLDIQDLIEELERIFYLELSKDNSNASYLYKDMSNCLVKLLIFYSNDKKVDFLYIKEREVGFYFNTRILRKENVVNLLEFITFAPRIRNFKLSNLINKLELSR